MNPLDATDQLRSFADRFVAAPGVVAYLDGNSLGRPLTASVDRVSRFMTEAWGGRLIRGWDEGWMEQGQRLGDRIARSCLGAAAGQTSIGDSTTVLLYKLIRAACDARPGRDQIVIDRANFPTDRYIVEGVAAERGLDIVWIDALPGQPEAVTGDQLSAAVGERTALVVLSHVDYRSAYRADVAALTTIAHDAGALILWDLCHSVGCVPIELDAWGVDLAVGCTYKYLNGGPGAPAFAYVASGQQQALRQPIQGWMGSSEPFTMGQGYVPGHGIRAFLSGTPPVISMLPIMDMVDLIETVGIEAIRAKSVALTEYAIALIDERLPEVVLASPRDAEHRGSHVTIDHERFESIMPELWQRGVIPDFRRPNGIRLGLSPLSTTFEEVEIGVNAIRGALDGTP